MNHKTLIITIACVLCLGHSSRAQNSEDTDVKRGLQLGGVQVLIMPPYHKSGSLTLQQMRSAAPESQLLQRDYSGFDEQFGYYEGGLIKMLPVSLLLNFDIQSKNEFIRKLRPELRIGLGYMGTQLTGSAMSREESFVTQDGLADSTHEQHMGFNNRVRMITGHVSLLVKSNPERRFSIYGGVGFEGGISLQSRNQVIFTENSKIYDEQDRINTMEFEHETESFETGTSQSYSVFMPAGVNLRFSKKHPFFSKLNIFTEFRWNYNRVKIDGVAGSFSNKFSLSSFEIQGGLGLRYKL